jgi:hypothetical protein
VVGRREGASPPSRISSEGGGGDVVGTRLAFRAREGVVMWLESVSRFERGRAQRSIGTTMGNRDDA